MRCSVTAAAAAFANSGASVLRGVAALNDSTVPRHQGPFLYCAVLHRGRGCKENRWGGGHSC